MRQLFADGGYQGPKFATALAKVLPHLDVQIVKRSDTAIGFKIVPKRWIVERTIAWLKLPTTAKIGKVSTGRGWLLALASIRLMAGLILIHCRGRTGVIHHLTAKPADIHLLDSTE